MISTLPCGRGPSFPRRLLLVCLALGIMHTPTILSAAPPVTLPAVDLKGFADPPPALSTAVTPALKDQAATVDKAANYQQMLAFLEARLTPAQEKFLNEHKFLLLPKSATKFRTKDKAGPEDSYDILEMVGMFEEVGGYPDPMSRRPENCRFVNPDVVLHALHKYLENSLELLEKRELAQTLRRFLTGMQAKALEHKAKSSGKMAERYELIAAQFIVPWVILENALWVTPPKTPGLPPPPGRTPPADDKDTLDNALRILDKFKGKVSAPLFGRMSEELRLIFAAKDVTPSPLFGQYGKDEAVKCDYTQYTPRSHYVKSSVLRSYFRAMMYLGRNSYLLAKDEGVTDALLATLVLAGPGPDGRPLLKDWQKIMEITGFYAGQADDVSYPQWRAFLIKVLGTDKLSPEDALNAATLAKIAGKLPELQGPRILSDVIIAPAVLQSTREQLLQATKGVRIFGQRFTFDAWLMSRLTAGEEKTPVRLPSLPSALFVPAAFGDQTAREFVGQYLQTLTPPFSQDEVAGFQRRLQEVAADLGKVKDAEWFGSVGAAWLRLLGTLTSSYGAGYPLYMQSKLFPVKQIESFLGSYTELKHDTLLYAKQVYAEMGDGSDEGAPPPVPKGFVEPNLPFWDGLARLVAYIESGYRKHGLFANHLEKFGHLAEFKEAVALYRGLALKELQGSPISDKDYEKLRVTSIRRMVEPLEPDMVLDPKDMRSGLIADVATDATQGKILYEATGEPYLMLVLVGNDGAVRVAAGVAYNHYEFTGPLDTRYTDDDWQKRVYEKAGPLPEKNFWYRSLLVQ